MSKPSGSNAPMHPSRRHRLAVRAAICMSCMPGLLEFAGGNTFSSLATTKPKPPIHRQKPKLQLYEAMALEDSGPSLRKVGGLRSVTDFHNCNFNICSKGSSSAAAVCIDTQSLQSSHAYSHGQLVHLISNLATEMPSRFSSLELASSPSRLKPRALHVLPCLSCKLSVNLCRAALFVHVSKVDGVES